MLAFLATLAGLLGIVVSVSQFQVSSASSATVRAYFSVILVTFVLVSALAYLGAMQDKDVRQLNLAVLGYFSTLLGVVVGLAATTLYPNDYQFAGFWITGPLTSFLFYWALQRYHGDIKWGSGKPAWIVPDDTRVV